MLGAISRVRSGRPSRIPADTVSARGVSDERVSKTASSRPPGRRGERAVGPLTLRARAMVAWVVIAVVLAAGLSALAYQLTLQHLVAEREDASVDRAYLNARLVRNALRAADPDVVSVLSSLGTNAGSTAMARIGGEWFSGSVGAGPDELPASLTDAVADGRAGHQRVRIDGTPQLAVGIPIVSADVRYFELVGLDDIERTLGGLAEGLVAGAAMAAVAAAAISWYATGRALRPLRRFATAAERIADGELSTRLETLDDRDLRALQRAFNRMAAAVQERIDREARFTSDVSHELRSPVAGMLSILSIARRTRDDPDASARALVELEERVGGLHGLVEDLLEISRMEAGVAQLQLEPVEPARLASAVVSAFGDRDVRVDVADDVPAVVLVDKRRAGQMLRNLVENAERYAGGVSRIEITSGQGRIRFAVEDHGPGIPEHERTYIFERFARGQTAAASEARGTGLGLALVAEHAALHGGTVRLEGRPTGGARFVIELPDGSDP